jgi:hypothetical protein
MKLTRPTPILAAGLVPALIIGSAGCSKSDNAAASAHLQEAKVALTNAAVDMKNAAVAGWDSLKDYTYDTRVQFSAAMERMTQRMDERIAQEKAQAPATASSDKQAAIADYDSARANLKARLVELGNASADTWDQAKAKVAEAWRRLKADYDRATS